jgi:hypothetical protein
VEQLKFDFQEELTRSAVLRTAASYVTGDRADEHGDAGDNFGRIASYWEAHLGFPITSPDVAIMMCLLKLSRINNNILNMDSWVDGCGYLALGAELSAKDA